MNSELNTERKPEITTNMTEPIFSYKKPYISEIVLCSILFVSCIVISYMYANLQKSYEAEPLFRMMAIISFILSVTISIIYKVRLVKNPKCIQKISEYNESKIKFEEERQKYLEWYEENRKINDSFHNNAETTDNSVDTMQFTNNNGFGYILLVKIIAFSELIISIIFAIINWNDNVDNYYPGSELSLENIIVNLRHTIGTIYLVVGIITFIILMMLAKTGENVIALRKGQRHTRNQLDEILEAIKSEKSK